VNLYLDSSVLLRIILREPGALDLSVLHSAESILSSELLAIECPRTIDRLRLQGSLSLEEAVERTLVPKDWLEAVDLVLLQRSILARASDPFPTPLGTLDAMHLATALVWKDREGRDLTMATHDGGLALASRAFQIPVLGG
jgi:predicted nucleic acid-binding protein